MAPTPPPGADRPPLRRASSGAWLGGAAAGLATHLRWPVGAVRCGFAALALAGGVGVLAYALLWALMAPAGTPAVAAAGPRAGAARPPRPAPSPEDALTADVRARLVWGLAALAAGGAVLASVVGLPVDAGAVLSVVVVGLGVSLAWGRLDVAERDRVLVTAGGGTRGGVMRLAAGVVLASLGLVLLVGGDADLAALRTVLAATASVLLGAGLLLAPWGLGLWRDLQAERAARERAAERAEIAAHLHDSVLQTLALVQRRSDDPAEVVRLARAQERELRAWLYAGQAPSGTPAAPASTLADAVRAAVAEVEDSSGVPVEVVVVGDAALDERGAALVQALREAVLNAVRHAAPPVDVYLEAAGGRVEAWVRDHGAGVDLASVPPDRLGIRESVVGRMARHGGSAVLRPAPGGGTEVALRLPAPSGAPSGAQPVEAR